MIGLVGLVSIKANKVEILGTGTGCSAHNNSAIRLSTWHKYHVVDQFAICQSAFVAQWLEI